MRRRAATGIAVSTILVGWVMPGCGSGGATYDFQLPDASGVTATDDGGTGATGPDATGPGSADGGVVVGHDSSAVSDSPSSRDAGAGSDATCAPSCGAKACGNDGCGGSCGTCAPGQTCSATGVCVGGATTDAGPDTCPSSSHNCGLHVLRGTGGAMGHIVNTAGNVVQIHGVNIGGTEYMCAGGSVFKDYTPGQGTVATLKSYNINAMRILLNEQCWLGVNGLPTISGGAAQYKQQIANLVNLLTSNGMIAIVDLHVAAPGTLQGQAFEIQMADTDHSVPFWADVAKTFANNSGVIFDLYNEPNGNLTWSCWQNGCTLTTQCTAGTCGSVSYQVAGMKQLLGAVRGAGAQNVVMMAGMGFSSDFSKWLASVPSDPNVVASWHMYDDIIGCPSCPSAMQTEQTDSIANVLAAGYPIIFSETGISAVDSPSSSSKTWFNGMLSLLESQGQGYTAYEWGIPGDNPALLSTVSSDGATVSLTSYGQVYTSHIAGLP